jgi:hypothetical protein
MISTEIFMTDSLSDIALSKANAQVAAAQAGVPVIKAFFDKATFTVTYVVHDPESRRAAIIDSVLLLGRCGYRLCGGEGAFS